MTIEGQLEYSGTHVIHNAQNTGMLALLGEDGNHYIRVRHAFMPSDYVVALSRIDDETLYYWGLSQADARTALGSLGLSGVVEANWYFGPFGGVSAPGYPFLWIPMFVDGDWTSVNPTRCIWLRYKVDSTGTVVLDGYHGGACSQSPKNGAYNHGSNGFWFIGPGEESCVVYGTQVIGDYVFFVMETGQHFLFSDSHQRHLVRLPLTGSSYSTVTGSYEDFITMLPTDGYYYFDDAGSLGNPGCAGIMEEPGGSGRIRIFVYMRDGLGNALGFGGAALATVWVNPDTHTTDGTWTDCSATFGIPFADTLYNYAGVLTGNYRNDYSGPSIVDNMLFMVRPFSDQLNYAKRWGFLIGGPDLTNITSFPPVTDLYTLEDPSGLNGQCEYIRLYEEGTTLFSMGRFNTQYVFGNMGTSPLANCPDEGIVYTFSALNNPLFIDWALEAAAPSSCESARSPADFESHLWTYYHLQDDTMFWMYSPYTITHLKNEARGPNGVGCLFQPVWEWADTVDTDKFAEQLQIYKVKSPDQTVIDSKNRVRGKGRALQFRYTSESMKDFNILGWGITIDKNTKP